MLVDQLTHLGGYNAARPSRKEAAARKRFDRFVDLALDAQAEASSCGGRDRKQWMRIAQIYCEMAIFTPRPRRESIPGPLAGTAVPDSPVEASPNGNGAVAGAAHQ